MNNVKFNNITITQNKNNALNSPRSLNEVQNETVWQVNNTNTQLFPNSYNNIKNKIVSKGANFNKLLNNFKDLQLSRNFIASRPQKIGAPPRLSTLRIKSRRNNTSKNNIKLPEVKKSRPAENSNKIASLLRKKYSYFEPNLPTRRRMH